MDKIIVLLACVFFVLSLLAPSKTTTTDKAPPDANYVFKKHKTDSPSSEAVATKTKEELLTQCKQEYELAKVIMTNRQTNVPMIKSLEKIYNDPQFPEELKLVAKNAVAIAEEEKRYTIQRNRIKAINDFANTAQKDCLKYN